MMENTKEKFVFEKLVLNTGDEVEFLVDGHFEIEGEDVEIEFYSSEPFIGDFIKSIKTGKRIANVKFIKGDEVKEFTDSKVLSIVGDYFVALEK
ncbi:MAG: hypothetical protein RR595_09795 [Lysinibacillus sp.]